MPTLEARALKALDDCLDLGPGERARALATLRASDPALHARVLRLLDADALQGPLLRSPQDVLAGCAAPPDDGGRGDDDPRLGAVLGAWRIDAVIGAGGMGTVYRASRADGQYAQVVALKCVSSAVDSPVLAEAIRNERHALAMLEHPNIATLLDGGIDGAGCPWLAMQLVHGEPIDQWCDRRRLGIRARVELFVRLCDGLAYAHGKAALHADIKPSNILVDDGGRPVLLDFGLSSLATQDGAARRRRVAMTPDYTAPEVPADGYSVRSDLYALGAVLYRLLCGSWPPRGLAPAALAGTDAPPPPLPGELAREGGDAAAQRRGLGSARALARTLDGDLDTIAAACVAPDPDRRYASVAQLQDDLSRWLQRRPVSARAHDAGYRLRLFLRRNWLSTALATCGLLGLGLGIGLPYGFHLQAERHAEVARSMRRLFEDAFDLLTTGSVGQSPLMSQAMLRDAEARLRGSMAHGASEGPDARAYGLMLMALARSYTTLGDYRHATALAREAWRLGEGRADQAPALNALFARLLNEQSHYAQALHATDAGLAGIDAVPRADREMARLVLQVERARAQWGLARLEAASATLEEAMAGAEAIAARDPVPLAELLIQRGRWRELFMRHEEAMRDFERARKLAQVRAPIVADSARAQLAGTLNVLEQHERAIKVATTLLESRRRMLGEGHPETGRAWAVLGDAQFWAGQLDASLASMRRGERILRAALGPDHPEVAMAMMGIDAVHSQRGESDQAVAGARRVLAIVERAHGPRHPRTMSALGHLAATLAVRASATPGAVEPWHEIVSLFDRKVRAGRSQGLPMLSARMFLLKAKLRLGPLGAEDERELERLIAEMEQAHGPNSDSVRGARFTLLELYMQQERFAEARPMLEAMLREFEQAPDSLSAKGDRFNCHEALGDIAQAQGRLADARGHWRAAHDLGLAFAPGQTATLRVAGKLAALDAAPGTKIASTR